MTEMEELEVKLQKQEELISELTNDEDFLFKYHKRIAEPKPDKSFISMTKTENFKVGSYFPKPMTFQPL